MAGLTKQHFKAIANIIKNNLMVDFNINQSMIEELGDYFKTQNPKFDSTKFREACLK